MCQSELAFENVYESFRPKIHRYLTRLVGESDADDLVQDVFIKVSQALAGYRGDSSLSTWLYRIATNTAYDRLRSPSFQRAGQNKPCDVNAEEIVDCDAWSGEKIPLVEQQLVKKEMGDCILSYIVRLPESYRSALILSDVEDLSNQEIAEILGITLDAVKIRLHRARAQLREEFETHCEYYWVSELSWQAI